MVVFQLGLKNGTSQGGGKGGVFRTLKVDISSVRHTMGQSMSDGLLSQGRSGETSMQVVFLKVV